MNPEIYPYAIDKLLEKIRSEHDETDRLDLIKQFDDLLQKDTAATFLYSPSFLYLLPVKVQGVTMPSVTVPADRFLGIQEWYIEKESIWPAFQKYTN